MHITQTKDIARILPLNQMVQAQHAKAHPDVFRSDLYPAAVTAYWQHFLRADAGNRLFIATEDGPEDGTEDGTDLGYTAIKIERRAQTPFAHARVRGILDHIAVAPQARRKGVAGHLIAASKSFMRAQGATDWTANVWSHNRASMALMEAQGATISNQNYCGAL